MKVDAVGAGKSPLAQTMPRVIDKGTAAFWKGMFVAALTVPESSSRMWVAGFHRAMSLYFSSAGALGLGSRNTVPELQLVLFRGITMLLVVLPLNETRPRLGFVKVLPPSADTARQVPVGQHPQSESQAVGRSALGWGQASGVAGGRGATDSARCRA